MFNDLKQQLSNITARLSGKGFLSEEHINKACSEISDVLLESDVGIDMVDSLVNKVKKKAAQTKIYESLSPQQTFVKLVKDELLFFIDNDQIDINLKGQPPVPIMLVGLQGSGKTTSTAKLAKLIAKSKKNIGLVSCDTYRPAARQQLQTLVKGSSKITFYDYAKETPALILEHAMKSAKKDFLDVILIDTAGRVSIDNEMMDELKELYQLASPKEVLFVVDAMMGQDALESARAFSNTVPVTGIVLTKADGDARGGAALSAQFVTNAPIKYIGLGESIDDLKKFNPTQMVSEILGMGDMLGLIEKAEKNLDTKKAQKLAKKLSQGQGFDLEDFKTQLSQLESMGGMDNILEKMPMHLRSKIPVDKMSFVDNSRFKKMKVIIDSMTKEEKQFPSIIKSSRKKRIANGSGTEVQDINQLLKMYVQMQSGIKKFKNKKGRNSISSMLDNFRS